LRWTHTHSVRERDTLKKTQAPAHATHTYTRTHTHTMCQRVTLTLKFTRIHTLALPLTITLTITLTIPRSHTQGKPAIESASGGLQHAALTAVRFRGKIGENEQEAGRYFLLASHGDPWAQRALIVHGLAGLKEAVGVVPTDGL